VRRSKSEQLMSALGQKHIWEGATDVRFTPNSGHWNSAAKRLLCAKSGHYAVQQLIALIGGMHCWMFASSWRGL
jgi:hypothetical protein